MIPGLTISDNGSVSTMGMNTGLYINGQPADVHDIVFLRPNEVEKVELYDFPTGKFSKDNMALNFVVKHYVYGGYLHLLGEQSLGINTGNYIASASLNRNSTTYSIFGGFNYSDLKNIQANSLEEYSLADRKVSREASSIQNFSNNNKYIQFRIKYQRPTKYFMGKLSFIENNLPSSHSRGSVITDCMESGLSASSTTSKSISPKIDLNGELSMDSASTLTWGVHGVYSHNKYDRLYSESPDEYLTQGREDASRVDARIIYTYNTKRGKLTAQLSNYYNVYKTHYTGYYSSTENLWKNEALAFLSYDCAFNDKMSLQTRIGVDWYQYRLRGFSRFNTWNPRLNLRINRNLGRSMLAWSFMLANSNNDANVINNAEIQINPFLIRKGNPNLKKSYDIDTYLYYSLPVCKFNFTAMLRYQFSKNPVTSVYQQGNECVIQTFESEGSNQEVSAVVGTTWQPTSKFAITGDIRWTYSKIGLLGKPHNVNFTGNCAFQWYVGNFQLSSGINLPSTTMNRYSGIKVHSPFNYNFAASYSHKGLIVSASIYSPFGKRSIKHTLSSPFYSFINRMLNHQNYQYCRFSISYLFEFGKKTEYSKPEINTEHNSSMLKES